MPSALTKRPSKDVKLSRLSYGALGLTLVAAACGGGGSGSASESDAGAATPPVSADDVAESVEDVVLAPLGDDGDEARLGDLLGDRPVVLNFFASWCVPCVEEMPGFEAVHQDVGDEVTFVGLAMMDGEERALDIVETTGVTYSTYADPNGSALTFFGGAQMPTTVFLTPEGEELETHSRELSESQLRGKLAEHYGVST